MQIQLTVRSKNFKAVTSRTESFESENIRNLVANLNSAGLPVLAGSAEFTLEVEGKRDDHYTVTETVAYITNLTGGVGAPSTVGSAVTGWTAVEYGTGGQHRTVLTRDATLTQAVAAAALAFGDKAYNFPLGLIKCSGGAATFTITGATATNTPEVGIGSVLGAGVQTTLGAAGATMEDILDGTATSAISAAGTDESYSFAAEAGVLDGTATAKAAFLNCAGNWAVSENITFSDIEITLTWEYLGALAV